MMKKKMKKQKRVEIDVDLNVCSRTISFDSSKSKKVRETAEAFL